MNENKNIPLYYGATSEIFHRAKVLRNNMTEAEKMLWEHISYNQLLGLKFRRQHPINKFIVDFYCHKHKLAIELDGDIHNMPSVEERDANREYILKELGIIIIRFKNHEVINNIPQVLEQIKQVIIDNQHV